MNQALFVCAGRLRSTVPVHVEMGRLAEDGFLLLINNCGDSGALIQLGRAVQTHLSESVLLNTRLDTESMEYQQTRWVADVGVGVLKVSKPDARAATAVAMGRGMSRTAWSYPSRVAWFDEKAEKLSPCQSLKQHERAVIPAPPPISRHAPAQASACRNTDNQQL